MLLAFCSDENQISSSNFLSMSRVMLFVAAVGALIQFVQTINVYYYNPNYFDSIESRQRNPLRPIVDRLSAIPNADLTSSTANYDSCVGTSGEFGICLSSSACNQNGGRPGGNCRSGSVCCININSQCSGSIRLNNTYWQSPTPSASASSWTSCSLTVQLDKELTEQRFSVCQLRLDFTRFAIAQPTAEGTCSTDTFAVKGADSEPPVICGDNDGQHMYIHVPPSGGEARNVSLVFSFGVDSSSLRLWNVRISMIPCGASYSAPPGCLQYFTGSMGEIRSFNWKDTLGTTRKLANQAYNICIRSELTSGQRTKRICYQPCKATNRGSSFLFSGSSSTSLTSNCQNDYLIVADYLLWYADKSYNADRLCGGMNIPIQLCTSDLPFNIFVKTDGSDPTTDTNIGFCLSYTQLIV